MALQELSVSVAEAKTLTDTIDTHTQASADAAEHIGNLERGMRGLQAEKQALGSRLAEQEDAINATRIQWSRERSNLEVEREQARTDAAEKQKTIDGGIDKFASIEATLATTLQAGKAEREHAERLKSERDKARFELDKMKSTIDAASQENQEIGAERDQALDQMSLFKNEREAALKEGHTAQQDRDRALDSLKTEQEKLRSHEQNDADSRQRLARLESERRDMTDARREADRRRQEAEDAMRSAQNRSGQEIEMLLKRIAQVEAEIDIATALADRERKAAAKARAEAEPRIAAWKAMSSLADEVEFEDEDEG
jgi:hypothetical protein